MLADYRGPVFWLHGEGSLPLLKLCKREFLSHYGNAYLHFSAFVLYVVGRDLVKGRSLLEVLSNVHKPDPDTQKVEGLGGRITL
jgi:hypothetical protein